MLWHLHEDSPPRKNWLHEGSISLGRLRAKPPSGRVATSHPCGLGRNDPRCVEHGDASVQRVAVHRICGHACMHVRMCEGVIEGACVHVALGQMNSGLEVECAPLSMWVSSAAFLKVRASNVTMWPCRVPQAPVAAVGALWPMRLTSSLRSNARTCEFSVHRHATTKQHQY